MVEATRPVDLESSAMTNVHFHLEGQVAIVTGAAQGIGAACAGRLSQGGADVALWDVDDLRGQALAAELTQRGRRAVFQHCNVAHKAEVDAALGATLAA